MTPSQDQYLGDFESVARGFDPRLEVNILTEMGRTVAGGYCEFTVRAYLPSVGGQPQQAVALVTAHTKADALTALTAKLREVYAGQPVLRTEPSTCTEAQKTELLAVLNRGCFAKRTKTHVLLNLHRYSQAQAQAKLDELQAEVERAEEGPAYRVSGEAYTVTPAA